MTVSELRKHLQELEAQGHGEKPVVIYRGHDPEPEVMEHAPRVERRGGVSWRTDGWGFEAEGEFLIFD